MARFVLKILLFLLPVWIVLLGVDHSYSDRIVQSNASFSRPFYDMSLSADSDYDVLICGNSRASLQYDPNILDSILDCDSYNLGFDGAPKNLQMVKYDCWLRHHAHPSLCIYNIDLWTMKAEYGKNREQLFPYFWKDKSLVRAFDRYQHYTFTEKYIPFRRYIGHRKLISGVFKGNLTFSKGYYGHNWTWQHLNGRDNKDLYKCACDSAMIVAFGDFIAREQSNGVQFLFVYAPMDVRIARIAERHQLTPEKAKTLIIKTDKRRASYYEYYSAKRWGAIDSYDFCLDSSYLGLSGTVELVRTMVDQRENPIPSPTEIDPTR